MCFFAVAFSNRGVDKVLVAHSATHTSVQLTQSVINDILCVIINDDMIDSDHVEHTDKA